MSPSRSSRPLDGHVSGCPDCLADRLSLSETQYAAQSPERRQRRHDTWHRSFVPRPTPPAADPTPTPTPTPTPPDADEPSCPHGYEHPAWCSRPGAHTSCRHCGQRIVLVNWAMGPGWVHQPPEAPFQDNQSRYCRTTVAEPPDPEDHPT